MADARSALLTLTTAWSSCSVRMVCNPGFRMAVQLIRLWRKRTPGWEPHWGIKDFGYCPSRPLPSSGTRSLMMLFFNLGVAYGELSRRWKPRDTSGRRATPGSESETSVRLGVELGEQERFLEALEHFQLLPRRTTQFIFRDGIGLRRSGLVQLGKDQRGSDRAGTCESSESHTRRKSTGSSSCGLKSRPLTRRRTPCAARSHRVGLSDSVRHSRLSDIALAGERWHFLPSRDSLPGRNRHLAGSCRLDMW